MNRFFFVLLTLFTTTMSHASRFQQPEGYVWDSSKSFLAPSVVPKIGPLEIEPWEKARVIALQFMQITLEKDIPELSSRDRIKLSEAINGLKRSRLLPSDTFRTSNEVLKNGFTLTDYILRYAECREGGVGAFVYLRRPEINICKYFIFVPDTYKVQVLVHESLHVAGLADEIRATEIERIVIRSNGWIPYENGYTIEPDPNETTKKLPIDMYKDLRAYFDPLAWLRIAPELRKCIISINQTSKNQFDLKGSLFRESASVYPNSLKDEKMVYGSFGADKTQLKKVKPGNIALLKRGQIDFYNKMQNLIEMKAAGIIIFDEESLDNSILSGLVSANLPADLYGRKTNIPIVGISKADGLMLKELIEANRQPSISVDCEY